MNRVKLKPVAVIGGGPAGLMAAEQLLESGHTVYLYDAMPSLARKFLRAGVGGMNITHSEPFSDFCQRYSHQQSLQPLLDAFGPAELRAWCEALGVETFVGSSGRVFPTTMKAAPLLRAWLYRLKHQGLNIFVRHRWLGWSESGALAFDHEGKRVTVEASAVVLALGGGSWKRLGSDGLWVSLLSAHGVPVESLQPSNCGFICHWSEHMRKHAGQPLKSVLLRFNGEERKGELVLGERGVEGSLIYGFSAPLRDELALAGRVCFELDLCPDRTQQQIDQVLSTPRKGKSLSTVLKSKLKISGAKAGLLFEVLTYQGIAFERAGDWIKRLPIEVTATAEMDRAISTAGGVSFDAVNDDLMLKGRPGVFVAGEMLDWEAPTGGYLLTACYATGRQAGLGAAKWLGA